MVALAHDVPPVPWPPAIQRSTMHNTAVCIVTLATEANRKNNLAQLQLGRLFVGGPERRSRAHDECKQERLIILRFLIMTIGFCSWIKRLGY